MTTDGEPPRDRRAYRGGVKMQRVDAVLRMETFAALEVVRLAEGRSIAGMVGVAVDWYVKEELMSNLGIITDKDVRKVVREYADECGCTVEMTGSNQVKVTFPGVPKPVIVTGSHSGGRVLTNVRSDLEAAKREWAKARPQEPTAAPLSVDGWSCGDAVSALVATSKGDVWRHAVISELEVTRAKLVFTDNGAQLWVPRSRLRKPEAETKHTNGTDAPASDEQALVAQLKAAGIDLARMWRVLGGGLVEDKQREVEDAERALTAADNDVVAAEAMLSSAREAAKAARERLTAVRAELAELSAKAR